MGQYEVLTFLKKERDKGNHKYFTITEVRDAMRKIKVADEVGGLLISLERYKLVEGQYTMNINAWHRIFRMTDATWKRFKEMEDIQ